MDGSAGGLAGLEELSRCFHEWRCLECGWREGPDGYSINGRGGAIYRAVPTTATIFSIWHSVSSALN